MFKRTAIIFTLGLFVSNFVFAENCSLGCHESIIEAKKTADTESHEDCHQAQSQEKNSDKSKSNQDCEMSNCLLKALDKKSDIYVLSQLNILNSNNSYVQSQQSLIFTGYRIFSNLEIVLFLELNRPRPPTLALFSKYQSFLI